MHHMPCNAEAIAVLHLPLLGTSQHLIPKACMCTQRPSEKGPAGAERAAGIGDAAAIQSIYPQVQSDTSAPFGVPAPVH